ncbi:MAG: sterol desaturase family protein [Alphaproteobacteria bacterium]
MKPEIIAILSIFVVFIIAEILFSSFFKKKGQNNTDGWVEFISTIALTGFTQPLVLFLAYGVMAVAAPGLEGAISGWPFWAGFLLLVVFDDMVQYWWHRASHSYAWLYKLHRPHHNAGYMSIRLVYRNNLFYYLFMPAIWMSGVLIYLGLGWTYAVYIVIKMTIIFGAHSDLQWDKPLYKIKWLAPVMWIVQRTISTPATHHAHHGKHKSDGVTHYKGNFGNMLFFWDVLFGTAKISQTYPPEYGVEDLPETTLGEQLLWPFINTGSDVSANKAR